MIERGAIALVGRLGTVSALSLVFAAVRITVGKFHVVRDEQVQVSVAVVVDPGRAGRPFARILHAGLLGNVRECAIAVVVEQCAPRIAGDVQIWIPIVIEIRNGHAHAVEGDSPWDSPQARLLAHVCELSVAKIAIERVVRRGAMRTVRGLAAGDEEQIEQAIAIEIQKGNTTSHGFDQEFLAGLAICVPPRNSGLGRGVGENVAGG